MKKILTLNDAFVVKLQALYDVESELTKALPKVASRAMDEDLKMALTDHWEETKRHVECLEECFKILEIEPEELETEAIRGLIVDIEWVMSQDISDEVIDSMLIAAALYVEHYEIAGYTSAANWANMLGYSEIEDLLSETLTEEEAAANKLSTLAEEKIDEVAMSAQ